MSKANEPVKKYLTTHSNFYYYVCPHCGKTVDVFPRCTYGIQHKCDVCGGKLFFSKGIYPWDKNYLMNYAGE